MNQTQENHLTRAENTDEVMDENAGIVAGVPQLLAKQTDLKNSITAVKQKDQQKGGVLSGKAQDKYDAETLMIDKALEVAAGLFTLGKDTGNNELKDTGDITKSKLTAMRDTQLIPFITNIYDKANANAAALVPYGITAIMITEFLTRITNYDNALGAREGAQSTKTGMTSSLGEFVKSMDEICEDIGTLSLVTKSGFPEFYVSLQSALVIRNLGESSGVLAGELAESETKNLFKTGITGTTKFKLSNRGATILQYFLNTNGGPGTGGIELNPGEEVIKLASELGNPGATYLNVTNLSATETGNYRVKRYVNT